MFSSQTLTNETAAMFLELTNQAYTSAIPTLIVLCILALLANVIVMISMRSIGSVRRCPYNLTLKIVFSLSASDAWTSVIFMVSLLANMYWPMGFVEAVPRFYSPEHHLLYGRSSFQLIYCIEALRLGALLTSLLHLLVLCLAHYGALAQPITFRDWTFCRQRIIVIAIFLYVTPPMGFMIIFLCHFDQTFNTDACDSEPFLNAFGFRLVVFLSMFIPLAFMTLVYIKIASLLKLNSNLALSAERRQNFIQKKVRTIVTGLLLVCTILISFIPCSVLLWLTCDSCLYPGRELLSRYPRLVITLAVCLNILIILKGLANPIIYYIRLSGVTEAMQDTYNCCSATTTMNGNQQETTFQN